MQNPTEATEIAEDTLPPKLERDPGVADDIWAELQRAKEASRRILAAFSSKITPQELRHSRVKTLCMGPHPLAQVATRAVATAPQSQG